MDYIRNMEMQMAKPFDKYKNKRFRYIAIAKAPRADEQSKLEAIKKTIPRWRNQEWIKTHIGKYYTDSPLLEYYWTIIGNGYKKDSSGNVYITQETANLVLMNEQFQSLKGKTFLTRRFANRYGKSCGIIISDQKAEDLDYGVYGIFQKGKIVYIGSTIRPFRERWKEHQANFKAGKSDTLYQAVKNEDLEYKVLFSVKDFLCSRPLSRSEIEAIELALITQYRPIGNVAGVKTPFTFTDG